MRSKHSIIRLDVCSKSTNFEQKHFDDKRVNFKDYSNQSISIRIYFFGVLNVTTTSQKVQIGSISDLKSRGLYIEIYNENIVIKNDWLASIPLFFNRKKLTISTDFQFCVESREIDEVGITYFLKYGYSVFGRTPVQDVEFLEYCSEISIQDDIILVKNISDPVLDEMYRDNSNVSDSIKLISDRLIEIAEHRDRVLIPLSGGFDSRLLTMLVQKKLGGSKIVNTSYGYSSKQFTSYEVKIAEEVSKRLKTKFKWIKLGNENNQILDWLSLKGASTHLHGMYQLDFYKKIVNELDDSSINISGIYGDLWAGKILTKIPHSINQYEKLFLSHGLNYSKNIDLKSNDELDLLLERFTRDKQFLGSNFFRAVTIARHKMILLSYLIDAPQNVGLETYSPFLDFEVVSSMLRLPSDQWENRKWQKKIFSDNNLMIKMPWSIESRSNMLYMHSYKNYDFPPLSYPHFNSEIKVRILELNRFFNRKSKPTYLSQYLITWFKLKKIPLIGKYIKQPLRDAVYDYYHIAPIEWSLNKFL